jgi:hypothetical protein
MRQGAPHFIFTFVVLMFFRVNTVFALSLDEFQAAIIRRSCSCVLDVLVCVASTLVKVLLFSLATHWLKRAVSFITVFLIGIFADYVPYSGLLWLTVTCILRQQQQHPSIATMTIVMQMTVTHKQQWLQQHWGHIHIHSLLCSLYITRMDLQFMGLSLLLLSDWCDLNLKTEIWCTFSACKIIVK